MNCVHVKNKKYTIRREALRYHKKTVAPVIGLFSSFNRQTLLTLSVSTALRILSHDRSWTICSHWWIEDLNQLWKPVRANILASLFGEPDRCFFLKKKQIQNRLISSPHWHFCINIPLGVNLLYWSSWQSKNWKPTWEAETPGSLWGFSRRCKAQRWSRPSSGSVWSSPAPEFRTPAPSLRWHRPPPDGEKKEKWTQTQQHSQTTQTRPQKTISHTCFSSCLYDMLRKSTFTALREQTHEKTNKPQFIKKIYTAYRLSSWEWSPAWIFACRRACCRCSGLCARRHKRNPRSEPASSAAPPESAGNSVETINTQISANENKSGDDLDPSVDTRPVLWFISCN